MNKIQIQRFIKKICGEDIPISYYNNKDRVSCMAKVRCVFIGLEKPLMTIMINRYWFNKYKKNPTVLRACLLHEAGHIFTDCYLINSMAIREYLAQKWAIEKADKLGMRAVVRYLESEWGWWIQEPWKGKFRRYRMAAMLKEQEI